MARNIFADGMDAFDSSYERTGKIYSDVARRKAGTALAGGDRAGAMTALGGNGDVGAVEALQQEQNRADETQYQHGKDQKELAIAEQERRVGHFKKITGAARGVDGASPEGLAKRKAFILEALPTVSAETGEDMSKFIAQVQALPPEKFDDQNLSAFDGELDKYITINRGGGGYDIVNQRTGAKVRGVEPTLKAPPGFDYDDQGALAPIPGYVAGRKAISEATRAPPRARASGGGGGGLGGVKTADLIAALKQ